MSQRILDLFACGAKPLDRCHLTAFDFARENETGIDRLSIDENQAGTAAANPAPVFRANESQILAQYVYQPAIRLYFYGNCPIIQMKCNLHFFIFRASTSSTHSG
jgi:hypothetical protein